jgi:hypothetical protein
LVEELGEVVSEGFHRGDVQVKRAAAEYFRPEVDSDVSVEESPSSCREWTNACAAGLVEQVKPAIVKFAKERSIKCTFGGASNGFKDTPSLIEGFAVSCAPSMPIVVASQVEAGVSANDRGHLHPW